MRLAVITGASSGLGAAIAERLVVSGWSIIGLARDRSKLAVVQEKIGIAFDFFAVDIADYSAVAGAFAEIAGRQGTIDLLVNNAAQFKMSPFGKCDVADIGAIIDTNLKGAMYCTHQALPLMKRPGGRIINIASVAATHGIRNQAIYCASKYGLDGFAEALSEELIDEGILISTICPGGIDTPLWQAPDNPYPGVRAEILAPDDVARMVDYVAGLPAHVVMKKVIMFPTNERH